MDWLVWITSLGNLILLVILGFRVERVEKTTKTIEKHAEVQALMGRARMGRVTSARASTPKPPVDSRVRTTKRDANDVPVTGRMSQGIHRKRVDLDSLENDRRLQRGDLDGAAPIGEPSGDPAEGP